MKTKNSQPDKNLEWSVDTVALLTEMVESSHSMGIFKIPINLFKNLLGEVAIRSSQLNDPIMNGLMCRLGLYEIANHKKENEDAIRKVMAKYENAKKELTANP